jgi:hypothetical protein
MFKHDTILPFEDLRDWLFQFSNEVSEGKYQKMSYNMWRHMNQYRDPDSDVFVDWDELEAEIYFPGDPTIHYFTRKDGSFGSFIFKEYLDDIAEWDNHYNKGVQCTSSDGYTKKNFKLDLDLSVCDQLKVTAEQAMANVKDVLFVPNDSGIAFGSDISCSIDTKVDKSEFDARIQELTEIIDKHTKKENENMNAFKFDFGPVNANTVRMSMYGLAVKNKVGTWVSYDAKAGEIMDADMFNFDGANFLYKMPVAMKDIVVGDIVIHHGRPMFVVGKSTDGKGLIVIDVIDGERKEVMLAKSPFGFNFATKVVNFLGNAFNSSANADNPFGNMWMLMAMSGDNKDMNDMLPFMMMANGGNVDTNMLMFMAMSGKGGNDMLPMLMMMNMNAPAKTEVHQCHCGGNCGEHHE